MDDSDPPTDETPAPIPSPFADLLGIVIAARGDGFCRLTCLVRDHHLNRNGIVHGGVLLSLADHAGGIAGSHAPAGEAPRRSVTVDLNCRFTRAVSSGQLVVEARVVSAGKSLFFVASEVRDADGRLLAFASSTHKWSRPRNTPAD